MNAHINIVLEFRISMPHKLLHTYSSQFRKNPSNVSSWLMVFVASPKSQSKLQFYSLIITHTFVQTFCCVISFVLFFFCAYKWKTFYCSFLHFCRSFCSPSAYISVKTNEKENELCFPFNRNTFICHFLCIFVILQYCSESQIRELFRAGRKHAN